MILVEKLCSKVGWMFSDYSDAQIEEMANHLWPELDASLKLKVIKGAQVTIDNARMERVWSYMSNETTYKDLENRVVRLWPNMPKNMRDSLVRRTQDKLNVERLR